MYRDMGPGRSLARVAQEYRDAGLRGSLPLFTRWSARDGWVERAEAWDADQDPRHLLALQSSRPSPDDAGFRSHAYARRCFSTKRSTSLGLNRSHRPSRMTRMSPLFAQSRTAWACTWRYSATS